MGLEACAWRLLPQRRGGAGDGAGRGPPSAPDKFKNPEAPAVKREAEEDWGKERWR
jgi:hypothetical protein